MSHNKVKWPSLRGFKPIDKEPWWANDTTPMYAFIDPKDGKETWV